jgi:rubrerythrin
VEQSYCDALRFALELERSGEKYYRESADQAQDPFARKVLGFLADEEVEHQRKIEEFNLSLLGQGEFDLDTECRTELPLRIQEFLKDHAAAPEGRTHAADEVDIYSMAMGMEKAGYDMYAAARDASAANPQLVRFFDFLISEETKHYDLLASSKKYLEDPAYYFEDFGGWIFG